MAKQNINLGAAPNGAGGDDRRSAWLKAINNFNEIYDFMAGSQSGSNSNGSWTKYPDGTMEVTGFVILPAQALNVGTSGARLFAQPFYGTAPTVVYSCDSAQGTGSQDSCGAVYMNGPYIHATMTQFTLNCHAYRLATSFPTRWSFIAKGRWK